jgi:hypothetical protein
MQHGASNCHWQALIELLLHHPVVVHLLAQLEQPLLTALALQQVATRIVSS